MIISLILRDGSTFAFTSVTSTISDQTIGFMPGVYAINPNIIQKTFGDGALAIGERNAKPQELTMTLKIIAQTDTLYRTAYRQIVVALRNTEYIHDTENGIRTRVEFLSVAEQFDDPVGSFMRAASLNVSFSQITPYWEDATITQLGPYTTATSGVSIVNDGDLPLPIDISLACETTSASLSSIRFFYSGFGLNLRFVNFFPNGEVCLFEIYNSAGITIGASDTVLPVVSINQFFSLGSGFFEMPVATETLNWGLAGVGSISITLSYRKRYLR